MNLGIKNRLLLFLVILLIFSCKQQTEKKETTTISKTSSVSYATGFSIEKKEKYTLLKVTNPWPEAEKEFTYVLIPKENLPNSTLQNNKFQAIIPVPLNSLVTTSTTHIPALEALEVLDQLVGFPETKYVSSKAARTRIDAGNIKELGSNQNLNTELVLETNPDAVVGFAINDQNTAYKTLKKSNIPVIYNGDWLEETPLGKAEWIKFFGALFEKEKEADSIFSGIETAYLQAKKMAEKVTSSPKVISGALYKDVWYAPKGDSWAASFIEDAHADYLWKNTSGKGSLAMSIETVLAEAQDAAVWVAPSQFTSYDEMQSASSHYAQLKVFQQKNIYTFASAKGATGGLLYYELAPQRPDLVLKDLIHIFHPNLLPEYQPIFFTPLQ